MRQSILKMDKHEIFELTEALYAYAILNHSGMHSELYGIQCEISTHYKPSMGFSESYTEENNEYYHELNDENVPTIWNKVEYVLNNRWEDMG